MTEKEKLLIIIKTFIGYVALILIGIRIGDSWLEKFVIALGLIFLFQVIITAIDTIIKKYA